MKPAGIEPATFRFVAQHINHCATAVTPKNEEVLRTIKDERNILRRVGQLDWSYLAYELPSKTHFLRKD